MALLWSVALCANGSEGGRILFPGAGETLVSGTSVEIRWLPLPEGAEEMELLLSIDGLDAASIRLTPQMDPRVGSFRWDVPRIVVSAARLRVRYGRDGRETDGESGEPFSISVSPCLGLSPLLHRDGELWIAPDDCLPSTACGLSGPVTVDSRHQDDSPAMPESSGERPGAQVLAGRLAATARRSVDGVRDPRPGTRSVPGGIIPARE